MATDTNHVNSHSFQLGPTATPKFPVIAVKI